MNIVISGENRLDDYGNFYFKDKAGDEHKIGEKRKNQTELQNLIESNPGKAVTLIKEEGYGKAKGQFYIVGIELVSEQLDAVSPSINREGYGKASSTVKPESREAIDTPPKVGPPKPQPKPTEKPVSRLDNIDKRCALIQATNLVQADKIGLQDWERWATEFVLFIER